MALDASEESRVAETAAREEADPSQRPKSRNRALRERDANEQYAYTGRMHQAFEMLTQGDMKQVDTLLSSYGDGTPYAGLRGFEWQFLQRSSQRPRQMLRGHEGEVYGVASRPMDDSSSRAARIARSACGIQRVARSCARFRAQKLHERLGFFARRPAVGEH